MGQKWRNNHDSSSRFFPSPERSKGDAVGGEEARKLVAPALDRLVLKALRLRHAMALIPLAARLGSVAVGQDAHVGPSLYCHE